MSSTVREITITVKARLAQETLADILSTAIEGGSNYWASIKVQRGDPDKGEPDYIAASFYDSEDPDSGGLVTLDLVAAGISRILSPEFQTNDALRQEVFMICSDPDAAGWDAGTADCIIQAALFNEIVYG